MALPRAALLLSAVDPNDPAVVDTWTDVAKTRMLRVKNAGRGRQYEIGQSIAGRMEADLLNIDEYLNPANASSPLLASTKLMRRVRWMGVLPADGVGNLVNLNNIKADPSFEAYAVGGGPPWLWYYGATPPQIVSAPTHSGTRAAQIAITAGAGLQGVVVELRFIPGDVYTASVWVNQSVANTVDLSINGHLPTPMVSTSTAGAWVKLTGTFTADQPTLQIAIVTRTPTLSGTLTIDEIQVEQGSAATAFTTAGPRIRGLWGGHTEKLPITWEQGSNGYTGTARLSAVGPLAAIAQIGVKTDYAAVMAAKQPNYWWPLWDGSNATSFAEISGNNKPALTRTDLAGSNPGAAAAPTYSAGAAMNIPGDPGGTGVQVSFSSGAVGCPITYIQTGQRGTPRLNIDASGNVNTCSVALWASWGPLITGDGYFFAMFDDAAACDLAFEWTLGGGGAGTIGFRVLAGMNSGANAISSAYYDVTAKSDNKPHLLVATVDIAAVAGTTVKLYVDGVLVAQSIADPAPASHKFNNPFTSVMVGSAANPTVGTTFPGLPGGAYSGLGIWSRLLSAQDVTDLWNGGQGYPGDTPGQRLNRLFGLYYVGPTVVDAGRTKLGPSGATDGTKLGQIAQRIVDSEAGVLAENRDAALEFDGRDTRFLATVPQAVFGENTAAGEIPYRDTPVFGYDTVQLNNQATVVQTGGTKANASDPASIKSYYQRSITVNTDAQSGLVAIDHATWLTANRSQPKQRVERITLDPGANPSIQAAVFDLEIGLRYTLKRVARSGNSGAGVTMTGDFFLENINHRDFDPEKGTWLVDLILSPVPLQPWILGDPTYGQLGITTVLGF